MIIVIDSKSFSHQLCILNLIRFGSAQLCSNQLYFTNCVLYKGNSFLALENPSLWKTRHFDQPRLIVTSTKFQKQHFIIPTIFWIVRNLRSLCFRVIPRYWIFCNLRNRKSYKISHLCYAFSFVNMINLDQKSFENLGSITKFFGWLYIFSSFVYFWRPIVFDQIKQRKL